MFKLNIINADFLNYSGEPVTQKDIALLIAKFFKKILVLSIFGGFLGVFFWWFYMGYSSEIKLDNKPSEYALDVVSWRKLQKNLPILVGNGLQLNLFSLDRLKTFENLKEEGWWSKNFIANFNLSKGDLKDLQVSGKLSDSVTQEIGSFTLRSSGKSPSESRDNVRLIANFVREGAAYLELRNFLDSLRAGYIDQASKLDSLLVNNEIEIGFLLKRAKGLEDLYRRFPMGAGVSPTLVDPKDSGAKYLSLATQIIAINSDINQLKEAGERLRDRKSEILIVGQFLNKSEVIMAENFDGIEVVQKLLMAEDDVRRTMEIKDLRAQVALNKIRDELSFTQARYKNILKSVNTPISKRNGLLTAIAVSFFATFMLSLISLVVVACSLRFLRASRHA